MAPGTEFVNFFEFFIVKIVDKIMVMGEAGLAPIFAAFCSILSMPCKMGEI
jgi:hypothetical protein